MWLILCTYIYKYIEVLSPNYKFEEIICLCGIPLETINFWHFEARNQKSEGHFRELDIS